MRCLLSATALLLLVVSAWAADEAKPNTLTPTEIADGWLLLFDGETTFGGTITGEVKAGDGVLTVGGDQSATVAPSSKWGDFELSVEYRTEGERPADITLKDVKRIGDHSFVLSAGRQPGPG